MATHQTSIAARPCANDFVFKKMPLKIESNWVVRAVSIAAAGLLSSCSPTSPKPAEQAANEVEPNIAIYPAFAMKMLAGSLRDPQSPQLSDMTAYRTGEKLTLCGKVNSKNGFGGYAGPAPFVLSDDGVFLADAATPAIQLTLCQGTTATPVPIY